MDAGKAAAGMVEIENHEQDWTVLEYVTWLLSLEGDVQAAIEAEVSRAMVLGEGHYTRVSSRVAVLNPRALIQIGFMQGATFAASALGVKPYGQ